jgi:hypothetical protein
VAQRHKFPLIDGIGLFHLRALDRHPFKEAVDRHDASALSIRLSEHGQPVHRLSLGIDRRRLGLFLAPVGDQPPLQEIERALACLRVLPDHPELLAWCTVVARRYVAEGITS